MKNRTPSIRLLLIAFMLAMQLLILQLARRHEWRERHTAPPATTQAAPR